MAYFNRAKKIKMTSEHRNRRHSSSQTLLAVGLVYCCIVQVQHASAMFNCFTPKMFNKFSKGGQQVPYPGGGGGLYRANWYPQLYPQQPFNQYPQYQYGMHRQYPSVKSLLFQPKWKGSSSLLGNKNWASSWRHMGASSNFYRPGLGYGYSAGGGSKFGPMAYLQQANHAGSYGASSNNYNPNDLLVGQPGGTSAPGYSPVLNSYPGATGGANSNDGWSIPAQHQVGQVGGHDSAGYTHNQHQHHIRQPTIDPYGSVKGGAGSTRHGSSTTKKGNILVADGGYSAYDAHLGADPLSLALLSNRTFGYSYPNSYSGVVDSPAKIAQQLMKYGLRQQRLQQEQTFARLAPLLSASNASSRLALLDDARFVGFGVIDALNSREARLSCSFNEPIDLSSPTWIKFLGQYNSTQMSGANIVPPFKCPNGQCRQQEIEPNKDSRYRLDNGPATSTLIITEPRTSDYGVYRCSALSRASPVSSLNNNNNNVSLNIIYKIVNLGETV